MVKDLASPSGFMKSLWSIGQTPLIYITVSLYFITVLLFLMLVMSGSETPCSGSVRVSSRYRHSHHQNNMEADLVRDILHAIRVMQHEGNKLRKIYVSYGKQQPTSRVTCTLTSYCKTLLITCVAEQPHRRICERKRERIAAMRIT